MSLNVTLHLDPATATDVRHAADNLGMTPAAFIVAATRKILDDNGPVPPVSPRLTPWLVGEIARAERATPAAVFDDSVNPAVDGGIDPAAVGDYLNDLVNA
ncbi:MAG: hypothetical protein LBM23_02725 [Propionibacteriaceae bacterium]|jgi:hypothetical protein|nr:hypothetical protein [Propionibacteriaceae bacterium]